MVPVPCLRRCTAHSDSAVWAQPSRQTELALFCAGHAVHNVARLSVAWGIAPAIPRGDVVLFVGSSAVILDAWRNRPETFRPAFFSVFQYIFGHSWRKRGSFSSFLRP